MLEALTTLDGTDLPLAVRSVASAHFSAGNVQPGPGDMLVHNPAPNASQPAVASGLYRAYRVKE